MAKITRWAHGLQQGYNDLARIDYTTLDKFKYSPDSEHLAGEVPLQTTLSSLFLDDNVKISSSGSDVAVTNLETNASGYPASTVLYDHRIPANRGPQGVLRASASTFGDLLDDGSGGFEPRGAPAAQGSVPFVLDTTLGTSISIYEIEVILEEPLSRRDRLHYTIYLGTDSTSGRAIYTDQLEGVDLSIGDTFSWNFPQHSNLFQGMVLHIEMLLDKGNLGDPNKFEPLQVRPSASETDKIYAKLLGREFSFTPLAYLPELFCSEYVLAQLTERNTLHFETCSIFITEDESPIVFETTAEHEQFDLDIADLKARVAALESTP